MNHQEEAIAAAQQAAVDNPQIQPSWVRIDPEFAFIQGDPRYQALIC